MKKTFVISILMVMLAYIGAADAAMMGGGTVTGGAIMGGDMGMSNSGGLGMMNGMAGAPGGGQ